MSVQPEERAFLEFQHQGDVAFGALMDALSPEEEGAPAAGEGAPAGGAEPDRGAAVPGSDAGAGRPDGGGNAQAGPADHGQPDATGGAQPADGGAADGSTEQPPTPGVPADWTVAGESLVPKLGELSTAFEQNVTKAYQRQAYDAAREDYGRYFEALEKHPRLLVGTEVPAIGKEGNEVLRTTEDAREWQEAVKSILVQDIRERSTVKMEESASFMQTVHASIDLFKNNPDLIPGAKNFNVDLANQFAEMMTPYEVRVDGKLQGYSIPVQPIIDGLRKRFIPVTKTPPAAAPSPAPLPERVEPPQAGIPSKAGSGSEKEDFSTLFGTIGLPNLQI